MSNFLPAKLLSNLKRDFHIDAEEFIQNHMEPAVTSVRINPAKDAQQFSNLKQVPWCKEGYYLEERPIFTLDPLFHAGTYYVQEASSMFIAHIIHTLGLDQQEVIGLDLCAAPGGKSTLLNSSLHPDSLLVANEIIKTRVNTLANNLTKWGNHNVIVTNNDPASFKRLPGFFDLMLVDAPCSGSGMFRKDPQSVNEWSEATVDLCSQRQQRILSDSLTTLKTAGVLIYSTCSYSIEENEEIADWLIAHHGLEPIHIPFDPSWGIIETMSPQKQAPCYRFYPNRVKGEGFFVSCFRKKEAQNTFNKKKVKLTSPSLDHSLLSHWIKPDIDFTSIPFKDDVFIIPTQHLVDFQSIQNVLYLKKAGTNVGKLNKRELIPHHDFALSNVKNETIQQIELSLDQALQYLRKADISLSTSTIGWTLATYKGFALGWMKILPNRINNYYPKDWRILNL